MMKLTLLGCGKNVPWTNARREIMTKLMGVDLFPTGNQVVKPTPLRQVVHRTIGTQTGTDDSLELVINHSTMQTIPPKPENNHSMTPLHEGKEYLDSKNLQSPIGSSFCVMQKETTSTSTL